MRDKKCAPLSNAMHFMIKRAGIPRPFLIIQDFIAQPDDLV